MPIYTYPQLKGKIKVGDTVIQEGKTKKVIEVGMDCFGLDDGLLYAYGYPEYSLELLEEKTLDTVDVGDVVVDPNGEESTILDTSKHGTVLFLSDWGCPERFGDGYTREELKDHKLTVKQPPHPVTMTREEAEKELSKDGKQVKIV